MICMNILILFIVLLLFSNGGSCSLITRKTIYDDQHIISLTGTDEGGFLGNILQIPWKPVKESFIV